MTKAFSDPANIAIFEFLIYHQQCVCGDLVKEIPISEATATKHLKELKEAGFIKGEIEGKKICYCINEKIWDEAMVSLNALFYNFKNKNNCCTEARFEN